MPKKFAGENTKATVARERKNAAQVEKQTKAAQAKEDAYWADDDKNVLRKQQRKEEEEKKRQQALQRKQELKAMHDEEINSISSSGKAKTTTPHKVTRAVIESNREAQEKLRLEEEERRRLEEKRIEPLAPEVEVNINQLDPDALNARNVEDAIKALTVEESSVDRHPEKRMKAAYTAFEDRNMPRLKEEHPTLRLSQLRQILKKEWQKSPENPLNQ
uniref:HMG box domain-containing protein n=1 Tax=Acrobeloides nanus TaxID=290746 RepID=A0A914C9C4_9BILA